MKTLSRVIRSITFTAALLLASTMARAQTATNTTPASGEFVCPCAMSKPHGVPRKILFFSKSSGYEHDMIKKKDGEQSRAEQILSYLGWRNNIQFTFTKDGSVFTPENIAKYDAFFFYTTGDLTKPGTDKNPPMSQAGKAALLQAIANGKGFIGTHSAADTFHSPSFRAKGPAHYQSDGDNADPYIKMLGGEFITHGAQQRARQICVDKNFPGMCAVTNDFGPLEEWYSLKNFAPNLHVLLVQDTSKMDIKGRNKPGYDRPNYPSTWAHEYGDGGLASTSSLHGGSLLTHKAQMHRKGRVFYTSMGHREDIWTNSVFQQVIVGGMNWAVGNVDADVTPNLQTAAPQAGVLPPKPD